MHSKEQKLTPDEHRKRHWQLHEALDELGADFMLHHRNKKPSNTTLLELMQWSHRQTDKPDELLKPKNDGTSRQETYNDARRKTVSQ